MKCCFSVYRSSTDKESKKGAPWFAFFCKYYIFLLIVNKLGSNCALFTWHTYKVLNFSIRNSICWTWTARLDNWEWFWRTEYTFDVEFLDFIAVICSLLICSYPLVPVIWIPLLGRELGLELSKKISCTGLLMFN